MGGSGLKMLTKVKSEIGWEKVGVDRSGWKWAGPWFRTTHQKSEQFIKDIDLFIN